MSILIFLIVVFIASFTYMIIDHAVKDSSDGPLYCLAASLALTFGIFLCVLLTLGLQKLFIK